MRRDFGALAQVTGDDSRSLVEPKGVEIRMCNSWRENPDEINDEIVPWARTFMCNSGAGCAVLVPESIDAAELGVVARDPEVVEAWKGRRIRELGASLARNSHEKNVRWRLETASPLNQIRNQLTPVPSRPAPCNCVIRRDSQRGIVLVEQAPGTERERRAEKVDDRARVHGGGARIAQRPVDTALWSGTGAMVPAAKEFSR